MWGSAFFLKLGMAILGELGSRLMDPVMMVDLLVSIGEKVAKKTDTEIDDLFVKALKRKKEKG